MGSSRQRVVGLITCPAYPELTEDNLLLLEPLQAVGLQPRVVEWDAAVDWSGFDALLVRQPWDYWDRADEFLAWLDAREREGPPMWNQPQTQRWNLHKRYLDDLAAAEVSVPSTEWIPAGSAATLDDTMRARGWERVVVKPAVSAGGFRTFAVHDRPSAEEEKEFATHLAERDMMVQPFLDAIVDDGEWSLVFTDGEFVASLLKRAAPGEFRVQDRHGGTVARAVAPDALVDQARAALAHAPGDLLYARVDGVWDGARFTLVELEIFEPVLFFGLIPGSAQRLARALAARLDRR